MKEQHYKMLVVGLMVVIGMLLWHTGFTAPQVSHLEERKADSQALPVMAIDNRTIYVLTNNKIHVFYWDNPETRALLPKVGKLKLLQTLDLHQKP